MTKHKLKYGQSYHMHASEMYVMARQIERIA